MHRRLYAQLAPLILLPLMASGCVQMTRHSNMMIFGTNTVVGVRAGVNASSVPEVAIGYTRQEAVILPLVANVGSTTGSGTTTTETLTDRTTNATKETVTTTGGRLNRLDPCDMSKPLPAPQPGEDTRAYRIHPCALVAVNDKAQDSYSVLASFGGTFEATSETGKPTGKAGVAQYFATGMAAQLLALNGGASVVATGQAATKSADKAPVTLDGLAPTAADFEKERLPMQAYSTLRATLQGKIANTKQVDLASDFAAFEKAIGGTPQNLFGFCQTPSRCASQVGRDAYVTNYTADSSKFEAAVTAWP